LVSNLFSLDFVRAFARWLTSIASERSSKLVSESCDSDIAIIGHGGTGTLLYCHLTGLPISRRFDQPASNGGNWFSFDRLSCRKLLQVGWQSIDEAVSDRRTSI
jgi:broad specificity phosphatase PhoE